MKIEEVSIELDKEYYYPGDHLTGKIFVKTNSFFDWSQKGKIFIKLYDNLNVEWLADENIGKSGITKVMYSNKKKPYQVNFVSLLDKHNIVKSNVLIESAFYYAFDFLLPIRLQSTIDVPLAYCKYYLKIYLSNDESVFKYYEKNANIFDELFKKLNHTYCKKEVIIYNKRPDILLSNHSINTAHIVQAKSLFLKVNVSLNKKHFVKGDTLVIRMLIENSNNSLILKEMFKITFNLIQLAKLIANKPCMRSRLFEYKIIHLTRKNLHNNHSNGILIEESISIPNDLTSTTFIGDYGKDSSNVYQMQPIRVNYKVSIELWKNVYSSDLDLNIPITIDSC